MSAAAMQCLDALEDALNDERRALIEHDVDRLLSSTRAKLAALRLVESQPLAADAPERVSALNALNRANGVLLSRRRREVNWTLRHLGRVEAGSVYDAAGVSGARVQARYFGAG